MASSAERIRWAARMPAGHLERVEWARTTRWFQALGHVFSVRSMDADVGDYLDELLTTFDVVPAPGAPDDSDRVYSVVVRPRAKARYALFFGRDRIVHSNNADLVLGYLFWHINRQVVTCSGKYVLLHAACAERDGVAVVLPAKMESGKTTTVSGLIRHGLRYLTDEATAIDPVTGLIHPFAKSLSIDPGSWAFLPDFEPLVPEAVKPWVTSQWHTDPRQVRSDALGSPAPPRLIVSPQYVSGATTELVPLRGVEAVLTMAENAFNLIDHGRAGLEVLADVVRRSQCYKLVVGELDEACEVIVGLLDEVTEAVSR